MNKPFLILALSAAFASSAAFAQASAPMAASAMSSGAVSAVCKDGTSYSGATMKGACRGHGGVDKKAASKMSAPAAAAAPAASSPAAAPKPMAAMSSSAPAAGGGPGKVWVNTSTKVYHCSGDKYYGKTKQGSYMSEADAKTKGYHADHGKACQ
ncbi:signal peptide protein [Paraburkholderia bryophila]|uniref:alanine-rich signal peptide protein n=1 Tax=Burkholderiaceae TaxID=119060 RepID=UPI0005504B57|nr:MULTISPECIES: alanine-rich signal peptide protein [Burkholderiaceae]